MQMWRAADAEIPEVRYARAGGVAIAYQTVGAHERDLVLVPMLSNLVFPWWNADWRSMYERFASFARLITFDKRGTGLSDRPRELGSLETRMDDIRIVLDEIGVERATLVGLGGGGQTCALFAATYPERTEALALSGTPARVVRTDDYPYGATDEDWRAELRRIREDWGTRDLFEAQAREMNLGADEDFVDWFVTCQRFCASPEAALTFFRVFGETDLREILPTIRVPTLVLYRLSARDQMLDVAQRIKGSRAVEISEESFAAAFRDIPREVEVFLSGAEDGYVADTVLTTVLFTDIVGSTEHAARLGDREWSELLREHHAVVRRELSRYRGQELDTAGDGFFATFDGPARAIRCAQTVVDGVRGLGLEIRAGLHTGECEVHEDKVAGLAVVIGSRVAASAEGGEVLVSQTVKDLVAGAGLEFEDRGARELKGVPGEWRLYAVANA